MILCKLCQDSTSRSLPTFTLVANPTSMIRYIIKKVIVIRPRPPICMRSNKTAWPKRVNWFNETVNKPVTHNADVAVKIRSRRGIGVVRAKGSARRQVPSPIAAHKVYKITLPGEKDVLFFVFISTSIIRISIYMHCSLS